VRGKGAGERGGAKKAGAGGASREIGKLFCEMFEILRRNVC